MIGAGVVFSSGSSVTGSGFFVVITVSVGDGLVVGTFVITGLVVVTFEGHPVLEHAIFLQNLTSMRTGGSAGALTMNSIFTFWNGKNEIDNNQQ